MPLGPTSKARLADCHPKLRRLVEEVSARLDRTRKHDLTVVCGRRNEADQNAAYAAGTSKLQYPDSKHNRMPSAAVDLAPYPTDWGHENGFAWLAGYVSAVADDLDIDIDVGALWRKFPDAPHIELTDRELNRP
jgi:hypothetical protein